MGYTRLQHFCVESWSGIGVGTTATITALTNNPCHLEMRITKVVPTLRLIKVKRRGTVYCYERIIKVSLTWSVFQDEPGDTTTHTFTITPWPGCETRFFYWRGTVGGAHSPSKSVHFNWHMPIQPIDAFFYPDAHPESTSCDGFAQRTLGAAGETWAQISSGAGTSASASTTTAAAGIIETGPAYPDKYVSIARVAMLFDISVIPANAKIISASLKLYGYLKYNWKNQFTHVNIYQSFPNSNTDIVAADYNHFLATPFSTPINYQNFKTLDWNTFNANEAFLQYIASVLTGDKIVKLAMREADYDAPNSPPVWKADGGFGYYITMSDYGLTTRPSLTITYQEL